MFKATTIFAALVGAVLFSNLAIAAENADRLTDKDIFELEVATDPQVSPDGSQIAYVRRSNNIMIDRARSNIWIVNADGSQNRPLLSGKANYTSPRWSPDGGRLAYVSSVEGDNQLYIRWMDTGQTAKITNLRSGPGSLAWSPDGRWLAFTMFVPGKPPKLGDMPAKPKGAEWNDPVKVIDKVIYRIDGRGFVPAGNTHIFVVPAEGGTPRQLTEGDYNDGGPLSWTADSNAIVFSANRQDDWEYTIRQSELYELSLDGDLKQLTDRLGPDFAPAVSPNGRYIAYLGFDDAERISSPITELYLMDRQSGETHSLTADLDRSVNNITWRSDNRAIYVQYTDQGITRLARIGLDGSRREVAENVGGVSLSRPYASGGYSVAGSTVAVLMARPERPADLGVVARNGTRQLTHLNDDLLGHKTLGTVEEVRYKSSFDDREIEGWLMKPPGFEDGKQYPLILEIHGGPHAAYGPSFAGELQLYTAAGYVVLYTNPRGSTSYGKEFANLIHHKYPGNDYDDLMSGVDTAIGMGLVDKDNMFVTGGSGGGVLTAWIVGKTDRFRAAAVQKPVINWASFVLTADFTPLFEGYWFPGPPWEEVDHYWKRSPLSLVGNVTTPTMLISGMEDHRTPPSEAEQFYMALKLRKIDSVLVKVPGAGHGIANRPTGLIAKVNNILAWFDRYRDHKDDAKGDAVAASD